MFALLDKNFCFSVEPEGEGAWLALLLALAASSGRYSTKLLSSLATSFPAFREFSMYLFLLLASDRRAVLPPRGIDFPMYLSLLSASDRQAAPLV